MKAKNSKIVTKGYLLFSIGLCCSIIVGISCIWLFVATSSWELERIEQRSTVYDLTFQRQIALTEDVSELYRSLNLLNVDRRINEAAVQSRISSQKMNLFNTLSQMESADVLLYQRMSEQIDNILDIKSSIRQLQLQVEQTRSDLQRCIQDNRDVTRRIIFNH